MSFFPLLIFTLHHNELSSLSTNIYETPIVIQADAIFCLGLCLSFVEGPSLRITLLFTGRKQSKVKSWKEWDETFSSFSLGLCEIVTIVVLRPRESWDKIHQPWGHLSFSGFFCPWFLLCSLQTISNVITAKQLYRRHMSGNPPFLLSYALSHTTSPHQPQDKRTSQEFRYVRIVIICYATFFLGSAVFETLCKKNFRQLKLLCQWKHKWKPLLLAFG